MIFLKKKWGIQLIDCREIWVENYINQNAYDGMYIDSSDEILIDQTQFSFNGDDNLQIDNSENIIISNSEITGANGDSSFFRCANLYVTNCIRVDILNTTISESSYMGIYFYLSDFITVKNSHIVNNDGDGINIDSSILNNS